MSITTKPSSPAAFIIMDPNNSINNKDDGIIITTELVGGGPVKNEEGESQVQNTVSGNNNNNDSIKYESSDDERLQITPDTIIMFPCTNHIAASATDTTAITTTVTAGVVTNTAIEVKNSSSIPNSGDTAVGASSNNNNKNLDDFDERISTLQTTMSCKKATVDQQQSSLHQKNKPNNPRKNDDDYDDEDDNPVTFDSSSDSSSNNSNKGIDTEEDDSCYDDEDDVLTTGKEGERRSSSKKKKKKSSKTPVVKSFLPTPPSRKVVKSIIDNSNTNTTTTATTNNNNNTGDFDAVCNDWDNFAITLPSLSAKSSAMIPTSRSFNKLKQSVPISSSASPPVSPTINTTKKTITSLGSIHSSMPVLSTPIENLLHQPFHGRQPSVIIEDITCLGTDFGIDDSDDNNNDYNNIGNKGNLIEEEEEEIISKKYSGMEVLHRITSQQEMTTSSSFCNNTANMPTTTSSPSSAAMTYVPSTPSSASHFQQQHHHHHHHRSYAANSNNASNVHSYDTITTTATTTATERKITESLLSKEVTTTAASTLSSDIAGFKIQKATAVVDNSNEKTKKNEVHDTANSGTSDDDRFIPYYKSTYFLDFISQYLIYKHYSKTVAVTWIGFWALLCVTCANHILTPMRDAIALQVGVDNIPKLTLASTVLAVFSSVPIGWLFEAPDPSRRLLFKKMGLTRGETQGSSLALFYRVFAFVLISYAVVFRSIEFIIRYYTAIESPQQQRMLSQEGGEEMMSNTKISTTDIASIWALVSQFLYIAFFLVVHLMKLHCLSLIWGVTTEAMEYEEESRTNKEKEKHNQNKHDQLEGSSNDSKGHTTTSTDTTQKTRLQRLSFIGFGGTLGGILGSILASTLANRLKLPGLLLMSAVLLEVSAQLSIELGRIMQKHWIRQQMIYLQQMNASNNDNSPSSNYQGNNDSMNISMNSTSDNMLDSSIKRSVSLGSMKRVASGNSLHRLNSSNSLSRVKSTSDLSFNTANNSSMGQATSNKNLMALLAQQQQQQQQQKQDSLNQKQHLADVGIDTTNDVVQEDDTFRQRLLRGVYTILRSRLLLAIFTYNALYASTTVLLSFQRAALVANRKISMSSSSSSSVQADTAFLANINMASSIAIFALQASGMGAHVAHFCGPRGTLSLMPIIRLLGVLTLAYWHRISGGKPPNLLIFLFLDECCKIMNMAIAKPVRESLWRGLSNEARYEAKPIVDTLANRWGGGSAAFLVSFVDRMIDLLGMGVSASSELRQQHQRNVFGFPPILFLCTIIAAWWVAVSADLGQIRKNIDIELKKRQ